MSIFGNPIGDCEWCGTPGLELSEYNGKNVCAVCQQILADYDNAGEIEAGYPEVHNLVKHANKYYPHET